MIIRSNFFFVNLIWFLWNIWKSNYYYSGVLFVRVKTQVFFSCSRNQLGNKEKRNIIFIIGFMEQTTKYGFCCCCCCWHLTFVIIKETYCYKEKNQVFFSFLTIFWQSNKCCQSLFGKENQRVMHIFFEKKNLSNFFLFGPKIFGQGGSIKISILDQKSKIGSKKNNNRCVWFHTSNRKIIHYYWWW